MHKSSRFVLALLLVLIIASAGCSGATPTSKPSPTAAATATPSPLPSPKATATPEPIEGPALSQVEGLAPEGIPGETYYAPFPQAITLDGDLSDWEGVPRVTIPQEAAQYPELSAVTFAAAADDTHLYFMADVTDDNIISGEHGTEYWNEDSVELYINATGDLSLTSYRDGVAQITIPPLNIGLSPAETVVGGVRGDTAGAQVAAVKTDGGWIIDQGANEVDEATLRAVHLLPYVAALKAGARNIMVSHSSWNGLRMHAHRYLLTDVLKGELGFTGFLVSDWASIDQIAPDYYTSVVTSINAGVDMVMVPFDGQRFIVNLTRAVETGDVHLERIDEAVRRILRVKFELGLFERPFGDDSLLPLVGSQAHRAVAREAVRKSLVLLKNDRTLPIAQDTPLIFVAGRAADDVGLQCGGWTIEWQGKAGDITPGTTLLAGVHNTVSENTTVRYDPAGRFSEDEAVADVGIVVLSEEPYAEGEGDRADLTLPAADVALVERVRPRCKKLVVLLFSGRPLIVTDHLDAWDAFVAAWLPGTEGQGIADVLFGDHPFVGKLPYTWPKSMAEIPRCPGDEPLFHFGYRAEESSI